MVEQWARLRNQDEDKRNRSQLKAFGEALRAKQGEEFLNRAKQVHPNKWQDFPEPPGKPTIDGYFNNNTPYLDALELMDRIVPGLNLGIEDPV